MSCVHCDRYLEASPAVAAADKYMPVDSSGAQCSDAELAIAGEWVSTWYPKSATQPRNISLGYSTADKSFDMTVEETMDNPAAGTPSVHWSSKVSSASKAFPDASHHAAQMDTRLFAPHYRIRITNTDAAANTVKLWAFEANE